MCGSKRCWVGAQSAARHSRRGAQVVDKGKELASNMSDGAKKATPGFLGADEAAGKVEDTAASIDQEAERKKAQE